MAKMLKGVTAHLSGKLGDPFWQKGAARVAQLPSCWIREDIIFWEVCATPKGLEGFRRLQAVLELVCKHEHKLVLNIVPCPWPGNPGWQKMVGGAWPKWFRPDFRLWDAIRESCQVLVDAVDREWSRLGRKKEDLRFEWFNEPGAGHVSGTGLDLEEGDWGLEFHALCYRILVAEGGINFRGHKLIGPTLSFFGRKGAEERELASATGGALGQWWEKIDQRSMNTAIYFERPMRTVEQVAREYHTEFERRLGLVTKLEVPTRLKTVSMHEWYITKPMVDNHTGQSSETFRAECIDAIGQELAKFKELEMALFYCLVQAPNPKATMYDAHNVDAPESFAALCRYLRN